MWFSRHLATEASLETTPPLSMKASSFFLLTLFLSTQQP